MDWVDVPVKLLPNENTIVPPTGDGGFVAAGCLNCVSGGDADGFIAKFDRSANLQWVKIFGTSNYDAI